MLKVQLLAKSPIFEMGTNLLTIDLYFPVKCLLCPLLPSIDSTGWFKSFINNQNLQV